MMQKSRGLSYVTIEDVEMNVKIKCMSSMTIIKIKKPYLHLDLQLPYNYSTNRYEHIRRKLLSLKKISIVSLKSSSNIVKLTRVTSVSLLLQINHQMPSSSTQCLKTALKKHKNEFFTPIVLSRLQAIPEDCVTSY